MTNQNPDPIVAPGIVEQLLRAHYGLVFDLRAENKELKVKLAQATATSELASKNADSWFASREEYWGRAQAAEKELSDAEDELRKQRNALDDSQVKLEKAQLALNDANMKIAGIEYDKLSLRQQVIDSKNSRDHLAEDIKKILQSCEGSYALMMEAIRKIRFLVASEKRHVPEGPAIPAEKLFLNGNLKLEAGRSGAGVVLEDSQGRCIKITANKLSPLGEYLLAVHLFNEAGGNDDV
ncbi:putative chromosome segregation protein [Corynebacterium phage phi16]|uniref:hypothetical protein n=1 Tax=Corynebacterium glutamicum TaxID=1718 RepID=UPI0009452E32|nr:hypothetical protein [Corynebacterium glutamicum]APQ42571.1 putative chromosome segregation protein [Corynebacterium phage phi16]OKX80526.1 hypothetical protein AUO95_10290 [Corynebacterium glutamicum]